MRADFYAEYFRVEDRHWWFVGRRRIVLTVLAANLSRVPNGRVRQVLDLGCGTGGMLEHLRQFGEVRGLDADERAIAFCHARGEDRVDLLESETLPFPNDSFDLLTALDVLEHIENDQKMLREIARVLRPGGLLLATVPAHRWMWGPQDEISHHFRRYSSEGLKREIRQAGLKLHRMTYFNTFLFPPIAAVRLGRRLRPASGEVRSDFVLGNGAATNRILTAAFSFEAGWLRRHDLPLGVSLLALAGVVPP